MTYIIIFATLLLQSGEGDHKLKKAIWRFIPYSLTGTKKEDNMKRAMKINYNYGSHPHSEVVGGLKAGRFWSDSDVQPRRKSVLKRRVKPTMTLRSVYGSFLLIVGLLLVWIAILDANQVEAQATETPVVQSESIVEVAQAALAIPVVIPSLTIPELITKYFPENPSKAIAISQCESHLIPDKMNTTPPDYSVGLFQINLYGKLALSRPSVEELKDPETNIRFARGLWESAGRTFSKDWKICSQLYNKGVL